MFVSVACRTDNLSLEAEPSWRQVCPLIVVALIWLGFVPSAIAAGGYETSATSDLSYMLSPPERARFPAASTMTLTPWIGFGTQTYYVGSEIESGSSRSYSAAGSSLYWSFLGVNQVGVSFAYNSFEYDEDGTTFSGWTGFDISYTLSLLRIGEDFALALSGKVLTPTGSGDFSDSGWQFNLGPWLQAGLGRRVILHSHAYGSFSGADENGYTHGTKLTVVGGLRLGLDNRIGSEGADFVLGLAGGYRFSLTEDADNQGAIPLSGRRMFRFWADVSYRLAEAARIYAGFAVVPVARNDWGHAGVELGGRLWF